MQGTHGGIIMADMILVINPGSTSTKIAVYRTIVTATKVSESSYGIPSQVPTEYDVKAVFTKNIMHGQDELSEFPDIPSQADYREALVEKTLAEEGIDLNDIAVIMGRGGLVQKPQITTGGYLVNDDLYEALKDPELTSPHASLLGGLIGRKLADKINGSSVVADDAVMCRGGSAVSCGLGGRREGAAKAYIYDAVTSIELGEVEEITGIKDIKRNGTGHVLNARAMAMKYADDIGEKYEDLNLIVIHTGGGSTVNAHKKGKIVDCLGDDETHMSLERSGGVPLLKFIKLCFSGKYTQDEIAKLVRGNGGMKALVGTSDGFEIENAMKAEMEEAARASTEGKEVTDGPVTKAVKAMAYGLAKSAGSLVPALGALPDAIIVTGGFAYSKDFTAILEEYVKPLGKLVVMPGEKEMDALAGGGLRIMMGKEEAKIYKKPE